MTEHLDYAIIGGGLSGIGAAVYYLKQYPGANQPQSKLKGNSKRFAVFEGRRDMGGTWDLFKYPGIRSDSDMLTFSFSFRPWQDFDNMVSPGPLILKYIKETAEEFGVTPHIRFCHRARTMSWCSKAKVWTVVFDRYDAESGAVAGQVTVTASFLMMCTGYYNYEEGFTPTEGPWATLRQDFKGEVVHPQRWPEGFDYTGKKVVVIGSGATAITLVPAMADKAKHVTMLQRSPTWMITLNSARPLPPFLKWVPSYVAAKCMWYMNVTAGWAQFVFCRAFPKLVGNFMKKLLHTVDKVPHEQIEKHFSPRYNVWDERFCVVANGDLFKELNAGRVSIVTANIDKFVENGILLKPEEEEKEKEAAEGAPSDDAAASPQKKAGELIEADVIVTATGLNVQLFGGAQLFIDGRPVSPYDHIVYRGVMVSGVPNFAIAIGYTNASWTLKIELAFQFVSRVLAHMDKAGAAVVTPTPKPSVRVTERSVFDLVSGYVRRAHSLLPRQGSEAPWQVLNSYPRDYFQIAKANPNDGTLVYSK